MSNRPCTCDDCDPEKSARVKNLRSQKILKPVPCESYKQSTFIIAAHSLFCCKVCAPSCLQRFPDTSSSPCTILHRQFLCKNKITDYLMILILLCQRVRRLLANIHLAHCHPTGFHSFFQAQGFQVGALLCAQQRQNGLSQTVINILLSLARAPATFLTVASQSQACAC